jgi:hypothetical protein
LYGENLEDLALTGQVNVKNGTSTDEIIEEKSKNNSKEGDCDKFFTQKAECILLQN